MQASNTFNRISPKWNACFTTILWLFALTVLLPVVLVVIISLTSAQSIAIKGYSFFPSSWSTAAYDGLMTTGTQIANSYKVTLAHTLIGTALSLTVMSLYAYVLAQPNFPMRKFYTFFLFFTMLFSGGLVPSYIVNVRYLHLYDSFWIFIFPSMVSAFNVIILRTFIQTTIPVSLF